MISSIFAAIQAFLALVGLWDQFLSWSDKKRLADAQAREQARNNAVDDQKNAKDEASFEKDQSTIVGNPP